MDFRRLTALAFLAYICIFQTNTHALRLTTQLPRNRVRTGETVKFVCKAERIRLGDLLRIVKKLENGQTIELTIGQQLKSPYSDLGRYSISYSSGDGVEQNQSYQLVIQDVQTEDRGAYGCMVLSRAVTTIGQFLHVYGPVQLMYMELMAGGEPKQTFRGRHNSVNLEILSHNRGQHLNCHVEGSIPMPQVKVLIGERDITPDFSSQENNYTTFSSYGIERIRSEIQLQNPLFRVFANESGQQLKCIASVPLHQPKTVSVTLDIKFPPQVTCNDVVAAPGDRDVTITCNGLANPRVTTDVWYSVKDGARSRLRNNSHHYSKIEFLENNKFLARLVIAEMHKGDDKHFGTYEIELSNSEGSNKPTRLELRKGKPAEVVETEMITEGPQPISDESKPRSAASVVVVSWLNLIAALLLAFI